MGELYAHIVGDNKPATFERTEMWWGLFNNFGHLASVWRLRREAVKEAEEFVGAPWQKAKKYFQVQKVEIAWTCSNRKDGE